MRKFYKRVVCQNGFSMSVQAGSSQYCSPRIDGAIRYSEVEVGFPSAEEPLIMEYAEDPSEPTETVYGWVPASVVKQVIEKHGGLEEGETPPLK